MIGKEFRGIGLAVAETRAHEGARAAGQARFISAGAAVEQELHQRLLHAGLLRMNACGNEAERGAAAVVDVRTGIHVGAGAKQQIGNLNDVLWGLLTVSFDTVRRDVMKQRATVFAAGAQVHKLGIGA